MYRKYIVNSSMLMLFIVVLFLCGSCAYRLRYSEKVTIYYVPDNLYYASEETLINSPHAEFSIELFREAVSDLDYGLWTIWKGSFLGIATIKNDKKIRFKTASYYGCYFKILSFPGFYRIEDKDKCLKWMKEMGNVSQRAHHH